MAENLRGLDALRAALQRHAKLIMTDLAAAAVQEMELVKEDSMNNTPVELGTLKASHEVKLRHDGKKIFVTIEVGGAAEPYALAVHEHLSEHSPPSWLAAEAAGNPVKWHRGGGPKFLENAFRTAMPALPARIAARVARRRS